MPFEALDFCDVIVTWPITRDHLNPTESTGTIFPSVRAEIELSLSFLVLYSLKNGALPNNYESEGREFESLRARHKSTIYRVSGCGTNRSVP
jgi:hypothetical protein